MEKLITKNFPRLLLVTGIPPGSSCGGIYLREICRCHQKERIFCFSCTGKNFLYNSEPDLDWIETRIRTRRHELHTVR